jgi:hypothetical protein
MAEPGGWAIEEYRTASGESPVRPHSKALGEGLYELRGKQVRLFYTFGPGRRMITLLNGIFKKQARRFKADLEARAKPPKNKK